MSETHAAIKWHRALLLLLDAILINGAIIIAMWLRFDGDVPAVWWGFFRLASLWITPLLLILGFALGLYNRVWEYARSEAAFAILFVVSAAMILGTAGIIYSEPDVFSRSILLITWLVAMLLIGLSRFGWRQIRRNLNVERTNGRGARVPVLVYGARHTGSGFVHHVETSRDAPYRILGFVDDDISLTGMIIGGHRVWGRGSDLPKLAEKLGAEEVILAAPSASGSRIRRMLAHVRDAGLRARTLPRLLETVARSPVVEDVRDVRYEDLLGRDMEDVDMHIEPDYISARTIMVTGAGGSIGSEICRQLCLHGPKKVVLLGRGENRIHRIYHRLQAEFPKIELVPCICNFTNPEHVSQLFAEHRPEVVFHAGAHKHVYLMEDNPGEAIRNNVIGTGVVASAAGEHGVERFVSISTDKAVEPRSVMGATKRLSEILLTRLDEQYATQFAAVRFGNVIGSSGSVLTIFKQQLAEARPLTVTHREATRFFMTVEEAVFLALHAAALGEGGEIFVLEMGEPVCIYQMAREFLELNGRDPDEPDAIRVTHLCPGEKVHERLHSFREELEATRSERIMRVARNGELETELTPAEILDWARRATVSRAEAEALLATVMASAEGVDTPRRLALEAAGGE